MADRYFSSDHHQESTGIDRATEWDNVKQRYLRPRDERPPSTARGVHHQALIARDLVETIEFYQDVLGFPLTDMFENRDYQGSTHFFFDIGHGNTLAFFDFPGLGLDEYAEVIGGHHHLAISMTRDEWEAARGRLAERGIEMLELHDASIYFQGPNGERLELISDPLGEMYGEAVL